MSQDSATATFLAPSSASARRSRRSTSSSASAEAPRSARRPTPSPRRSSSPSSSSTCAAFISNVDDKNDKTVQFRNASYHLPAWSVSIPPDCMNLVFNTAKVTSQKNIVAMIPESLQQTDIGVNSFKWGIVKEKPGISGKPDFVKNGFVDLINATKDTTDYLWHRSRNIEAISLMPSITIFFKQRHMYGNLVRQNFAVAQLYHNNAAPSNQNLEISTFVNAARTFRPSLLLDAYYRKELRDLFRSFHHLLLPIHQHGGCIIDQD
ncbi:hypothetical protein Fmac_001182 [Flemingia macrophylla]|uniref:Beta-galactosidase beta-sandwich domain-containing protein n=1 Tax=Flemingia macrophylla TaxID=520843 RepID=A0ABD1NGD2_9FABA